MKKKEHAITFRVTDEEYKMIKEKAKKVGLTVTQFIVKSCEINEDDALKKIK